MSESAEQIALFEWAAWSTGIIPELELLHHIPNGGHRNISTAARLKREGVKPGVPDICLPVPRQAYHGLYIELKAGKGKLSDAQRWWIERLDQQGYKAVCCNGFEMAQQEILNYLEG